MMKLNVVVLYTQQLEAIRSFFEKIGFPMMVEQHGNGPLHYSSVLEEGVVLELYPGQVASNVRFTFCVASVDALQEKFTMNEVRIEDSGIRDDRKCLLVIDPDKRQIEFIE